MFDDTSPFETTHAGQPTLQRTRGVARCTFKLRDGRAVLDDLALSGSFKVRLPKLPAGSMPEAVLLNTAGGLTGGDRLSFSGGVAPGAEAVFTTQASERAYRALSGEAEMSTHLSAGAGAVLHWLPQETILFNGARLSRTFDVDLAEGAVLLAHESIVFGRAAMGEVVRHGLFADLWRVRRAGRLIHADAVRVDDDIAGKLDRAAALGGAGATATILYIGDDVEARLDAVRDLVTDAAAGVSAWNGKLVLRAVAPDGTALRRIVMPVLTELRDGRALPRVWNI